eukprot:TRINITY_DN11095_c0_g1_i12.p1 TRINITY_DN11095_c0_g1~~TRINITY_DN11095_c0_g1_i12.p1  ORF type:complete len:671 (-),score=174.31 TRINITY_DN11095_c0_g1_i12:480-2465(-)
MDNVMEVQKQIKENAAEVNDFLKDLDSWAAEMKVKDNQLREQKLSKINSPNGKENSSPSSSSSLTPTKPSTPTTTNISMKHKQTENKPKESKKKEKTKSKQIPSPPKKDKPSTSAVTKSKSGERIKAYEYDKWDKFDVEEECSKLDADNPGMDEDSDGSSSEEDEQIENLRLKQQAIAERERGNSFFKQKNFDKAIEKYSAGMQIDPYCPLLPANRAMAFLKVEKYGAAEQDCSLSLSLDPTYIKALHRRVQARIGLKKYHEAMMDCEKILELEPGNKLAKSDKEQLQKKLGEGSKAAEGDTKSKEEAIKEEVKERIEKLNIKDGMKNMFGPVKEKPHMQRLEPTSDVSPELLLHPDDSDKRGKFEERAPWSTPDPELIIHPVQKPPHQRSKKPMQRITILESEPEAAKKPKSFRMPIMEVESITGDESVPLEISPSERFVELPMDTSDKESSKASIESEQISSTPTSEPFKIVEVIDETENSMDTTEDTLAAENENDGTADEKEKKVDDGFMSKSRGFSRQVEKDLNSEQLQKETERVESVTIPGIAKTSAQFSKDWRNLKTSETRLQYLSQLGRDSYPTVFKSQMESKLFSEILTVLSQESTSPQLIADHLMGLSKLPRISALVMFLSPGEQRTMTSLLDRAHTCLSAEESSHVKSILM